MTSPFMGYQPKLLWTKMPVLLPGATKRMRGFKAVLPMGEAMPEAPSLVLVYHVITTEPSPLEPQPLWRMQIEQFAQDFDEHGVERLRPAGEVPLSIFVDARMQLVPPTILMGVLLHGNNLEVHQMAAQQIGLIHISQLSPDGRMKT